jgi:hypothetical protein
MLRQKWSRGQVEARFANMPPCLIGMEAVGAHHLSRKLKELGHSPFRARRFLAPMIQRQILAKRMVKGIKTSQHQAA